MHVYRRPGGQDHANQLYTHLELSDCHPQVHNKMLDMWCTEVWALLRSHCQAKQPASGEGSGAGVAANVAAPLSSAAPAAGLAWPGEMQPADGVALAKKHAAVCAAVLRPTAKK
jgi:hypothetical protein